MSPARVVFVLVDGEFDEELVATLPENFKLSLGGPRTDRFVCFRAPQNTSETADESSSRIGFRS